MTELSTNSGLTFLPHENFFDDSQVSLGLFRSCAETKVSCKKIMCLHMLRDTCHPAPPITSHSEISLVRWWGQFPAVIMDILNWLLYVWRVGAIRLKGCIVQHLVQTWFLLQSFRGLTFESLFRKVTVGVGVLHRVYRPWVPFRVPGNTPNSEPLEGHSRTQGA